MARTATDPRAAPVSGWRLLRDRIIPRTALGLSTLFLFAAIGAAFSGAVLFAYYQWRLDQNEATLTSLVENFDDEVAGAKEEITADRDDATEQIRQELEPLQKLVASGETLEQLLEVVSPSMWFVVSRDEAGAPSVGSAFVVASDSEQSFLLTSYNTVRAVTRQPAPALTVRKGGEEVSATLWTWDESRDLALLVIGRGNQPRLEWTDDPNIVGIGDRVFVVSGLGSAGAAVVQGSVADVSSAGLQHDAAVGSAFQGGPVVTSQGEVIGVASRTYSPLGFRPEEVFFAVPIRDSCDRVLRCPSGGDPGGAGERR
jgi:S1-C subfamily serine protease